MNLRHIDPRSTEWMETIEEMVAREAGDEDGDGDENALKVKPGSSRGTGGRLASGGSSDHGVMNASSTASSRR
jgi:hypothetical protein